MRFNLLLVVSLCLSILTACEKSDSEHRSVEEPEQITLDTDATNTSNAANTEEIGETVKQCIRCHGKMGLQTKYGAPYIAGQQAEYMIAALQAYKNSTRKNFAMRSVVSALSDAQIRDLAAYYAQQNGAWKGDVSATPQVAIGGSVTRGQIAATPCVDCHGDDGNSVKSGVPSLAGLRPEYFLNAFENYFSERRQGTIMKHFKHAVDWQLLQDLAAYYSTKKRYNKKLKVAGNAKRGKKLSTQCMGCHGVKGSTLIPNMPDLAAQNADYLVKAIKAYKNRSRQNSLMESAVAALNNQQIRDLAAYYGQLEATDFKSTALVAGFNPIKEGQQLSMNCQGCHGEDGNSTNAGVPKISGLSVAYILAALDQYAQEQRPHRMMQAFAKHIKPVQAEKLALFYAQVPRRSGQLDKPVTTDMVELLASCNNCHGNNGNSENDEIPSLAAQDKQYIVDALKAYQSGIRSYEDMQAASKSLSTEDIQKLANYYSAIKLHAVPPKALEPPANLAAKCDRCHGIAGKSVQANTPRLAGQKLEYLTQTLLDYKNRDRNHSTMHAMADVLSLSEVEAIAAYYAAQ